MGQTTPAGRVTISGGPVADKPKRVSVEDAMRCVTPDLAFRDALIKEGKIDPSHLPTRGPSGYEKEGEDGDITNRESDS